MHNGYYPKYIDHIDGNPLNNKIENLREASGTENMCNVSVKNNNTSGEKGVSWDIVKHKWVAYAYNKGKKVYAGYHKNFEDAVIEVRKLRLKLHGSFARN